MHIIHKALGGTAIQKPLHDLGIMRIKQNKGYDLVANYDCPVADLYSRHTKKTKGGEGRRTNGSEVNAMRVSEVTLARSVA
jgi:hypothetical protein